MDGRFRRSRRHRRQVPLQVSVEGVLPEGVPVGPTECMNTCTPTSTLYISCRRNCEEELTMGTEDEPLPIGAARVPQWWMEATPHNILDLEEGEHWRPVEVSFYKVKLRRSVAHNAADHATTRICQSLQFPKEEDTPVQDEATAYTCTNMTESEVPLIESEDIGNQSTSAIEALEAPRVTFIDAFKDEVAAVIADEENEGKLASPGNESLSTTRELTEPIRGDAELSLDEENKGASVPEEFKSRVEDETATGTTFAQAATTSQEEEMLIVKKKRISFTTFERREYPICPGDNPSGIAGVPLSIEWTFTDSVMLSIDDYEAYRATPRTSAELRIPSNIRWNMLKESGFNRKELLVSLKNANLARGRRRRTVETLNLAPIEEAIERGVRALLNSTIRRRTKQQERKFLQGWSDAPLIEKEIERQSVDGKASNLQWKEFRHQEQTTETTLASTD